MTVFGMAEIDSGGDLAELVATVLATWPKHEAYLRASFGGRSRALLDVSEQIAGDIVRMAGKAPERLDGYCADYRFLCEELILPEELHFRRSGSYRLSSAVDAYREVYSNRALMARYLNGLLLSYVLWDPHARAIDAYVRQYLPSLPPGAEHLEIGPGHGLLLSLAASRDGIGTVTGWDISPASIAQTRSALDTMGAPDRVHLKLHDALDPDQQPAKSFDSIVMSELLEHLEQPGAALTAARRLLRPGGRVWINVPVNSPAPDHIYLLRSPEEACALVEGAGFTIVDQQSFPMTGKTLDEARRKKLSISCVMTATPTATDAP